MSGGGGGVEHHIVIINPATTPHGHSAELVKAEYATDIESHPHNLQQNPQGFHNSRFDYNYSSTLLNLDTYQNVKTRTRWNESPEARERRLARNAARMRDKRSKESDDEYKARLAKNAEANRVRRQNENEVQRALRLMKNAARQRLRRASETPEERVKRLAKAAERMRLARANAPKIDKPPLADRLKGY
ncbi:uncharacterized protein LOC129908726 [Episyrphus balteatus]|uniref:uncharacterized protein LOC129908726 n=1 Tax=Episyrphus balteatus TaxID=286459 RepID=UPI002486CC25|nr:uncharacterized protein LOC129908726 [Episyrphus balteatus]